jgi:hypothetical protein
LPTVSAQGVAQGLKKNIPNATFRQCQQAKIKKNIIKMIHHKKSDDLIFE